MLYKFLFHKQEVKLGISIAPNVCGKGLSIAHYEDIKINNHAENGDNLRIHEGLRLMHRGKCSGCERYFGKRNNICR